MIQPLRAAVVALLEARGAPGLAAIVAGAELEIAGPGERWTMGSREVTATRFSLVVAAPAFVALTADAAKLTAVRDALASAVRTPETELADLTTVLRLPVVERGWHHVYREAAARAAPDRPEPAAVLGGAAALLDASGDAGGAEILRRARLESAPLPGDGPVALLRYLVRLDAADHRAIARDVARADRLKRAVHDAGTGAAATVASVEFGVALPPGDAPPGDAETAEARLVAALQARGAVVMAIWRDETRVALAVGFGRALLRVEIAKDADGGIARRGANLLEVTVPTRHLGTAEQARAVAARLRTDGDADGDPAPDAA